jgi:hypothetical protein
MNPTSSGIDSMDTSALSRVRSLLPWYAIGALDASELAFMTHWLGQNVASFPEISAELDWLRSTSMQLQTQTSAQASKAEQRQASDEGLALLMRRIALETSGQKALPQSSATQVTVIAPRYWHTWQNMAQWVQRNFAFRSPAMAMGLAALVLVQAGFIGTLLWRAPTEQIPLGADAVLAPTGFSLITVAFKPEASEQSIRQFLLANTASMVDGPSPLGLYTLRVPSAQKQSTLAKLRAEQTIVESAQ